MSLDVYLHVDGKEVYSSNITHNLNKMAAVAGIYQALWRPEELNIELAGDLIPLLREGLLKLIESPSTYKEYDSSNGWGIYDHFVPFVCKYLSACYENPTAVVSISR